MKERAKEKTKDVLAGLVVLLVLVALYLLPAFILSDTAPWDTLAGEIVLAVVSGVTALATAAVLLYLAGLVVYEVGGLLVRWALGRPVVRRTPEDYQRELDWLPERDR